MDEAEVGLEKKYPGLPLPPMLPHLPPVPSIGQTQPQTWEPKKGRQWDEPSLPTQYRARREMEDGQEGKWAQD